MAYPRFAGIVLNGRGIDIAITEQRWEDAVAMLKKARADLEVKKKNRREKIRKARPGSVHIETNKVVIKRIQAKLAKINNSLWGPRNKPGASLIRKAVNTEKARLARQRSMRTPTRLKPHKHR